MLKQVVLQCFLIYFLMFFIYPQCSRGSILPGYQVTERTLLFHINIMDKDVNYDKTLNGDYESGFNLTDDEIKKLKLWPKGNIPYYIDVHSFSDKVFRDRIRWFLNEVNGVTGLNFMELPSPPKNDKTRWVFFINRRGLLGCADHSIKNFTNEGVQQVVLGYDCMSTGGELPEAVLSIAGVPPQHNAPDRDTYIKVLDENILPEKKYLFEKLKDDEWLFHDLKYDSTSAGHYHYHKYSANGRTTIEPQENFNGVTTNNGLSFSDILKIKMLYNYIAKKIEDKVPECDKLFVKGTKFNRYNPTNKEIKPLKKPNKYLGLPEENNNDQKIKDSKEASHLSAVVLSSEENNKEVDTDDKLIKERDEFKEIPDLIPSSDRDYKKQKNRPKLITLKKQVHRDDPLSYLSDYHTGDENYDKRLLKNIGVQYMKFGKAFDRASSKTRQARRMK